MTGVPPAIRVRRDRFCYLAAYGQWENGPMPPCSGRLIKAHLIPRQIIKRYGGDPLDPRSWVWACGGIMGNSGHHGSLDSSRRLRLARSAIPETTETLARELGIEWWLARTYGELSVRA